MERKLDPEYRRKRREDAAQLIAKGELTDPEIASRVGVSVTTIWRWRQDPKFSARVDGLVARINAALGRRAISHSEQRVARLNSTWLKLQRVIEERAADPRFEGVAGGKTGMIVHNVKGVGKGEDFQLIDLYEVDTAVLAELRAIERQAAQELGQWEEKAAIKTDGVTEIRYVNNWRTPGADDPAPVPPPRPKEGSE